jgi:hypothetical protein
LIGAADLVVKFRATQRPIFVAAILCVVAAALPAALLAGVATPRHAGTAPIRTAAIVRAAQPARRIAAFLVLEC